MQLVIFFALVFLIYVSSSKTRPDLKETEDHHEKAAMMPRAHEAEHSSKPTNPPLTMDAMEEMAHKIGLLLMPQDPHKRSSHLTRNFGRYKRHSVHEEQTPLSEQEVSYLDPVENSDAIGQHNRRKRDHGTSLHAE